MTCESTHGAERFHEVQLLAYYHWIDRGCPLGGNGLEDWVLAELEVALKHFLEDPKTHNV